MPVEEFEISDTSVLKYVQCTSVPKVMIIAGPNGVGKSTLLETITNLLRDPRRARAYALIRLRASVHSCS